MDSSRSRVVGRVARNVSRRGRKAAGRCCVEGLEDRVLLTTALLPDLTPWANQTRGFVYGWELDTTTQPGHTLLRLSNAVANVGSGAFEVRGSTTYADGTQDVLQRVYNDDGTFTDRLAGKFVYHPTHNHTHFEGLAQYNLRTVAANNGVGGVIAGGIKTSFCLVDTIKYSPAVTGTPASAVYVTCTPTRQGISVGWSDIYDKSLPDQWIDVTSVPGGRYWLEVVTDPDNHVLESDETNNTTRIQIDLPGATNGLVQSQVASGLSNPTSMAMSPDGKLFVDEQAGTMEVWQDNSRLQANFFRDTPLVTQSATERGLLGVAFDPAYATNRFVYVYYTSGAADAHNRVSRFTANATGDLALAGSEKILLELDPHSSGYHQGGAIHFGTDGKLYIATGDDGNQDNGTGVHNSQRLTTLHGKILRINADGTIPADNPFVAQTTGKYQSIWAMGLRNPFTFAVQPGTGRTFINDVGEATWEEINDGAAKANYGWPTTEGDFVQTSFPNFTRPFYAYNHASTDTPSGQAITGGAFYNPTTNQFGVDYLGDYFFADYLSNKIYRLDTTTKIVTEFATIPVGVDSVVDLTVDPAGNVYYLARNSNSGGPGQVYRISSSNNPAPSIIQQPPSRTVAIDQATSFNVIASGTNLTYQWQRAAAATPDKFANIAGATAATYDIASPQPSDNGARFRVIVTNPSGSVISNVGTLSVTSNHAPTGAILTPGVGDTYFAGQTINFSGTASDVEDGASLPPSAFVWEVRFYHYDAEDVHFHPFNTFPDVSSGSFVVPADGETSASVFYRLILTITDSQGATRTIQRDIYPKTVTINLGSNPAGLGLTLDGQPAPASFVGVVGSIRTLGAPNQTVNGNGYLFSSWSDGGAATHTITTPATGQTYTAKYVPGAVPGVKAEFFDFNTNIYAIPNFATLTPDLVRGDAQVNYPETSTSWAGLNSNYASTFASRHSGYLKVPTAGSYTLYLNSNDGSALYIDGQLVIDNGGNHAMTELSAVRTLTAGYHTFRVEFYQNLNNSGLVLSWAGPGIAKQVIPAANFFQAIAPASNPPTVQTAASGVPKTVFGKTATLTALGADDGGEANLTYTWATTGTPPAAVTFASNGTNAAKTATVTFAKAGVYNFVVTIKDADGQTVTSATSVTVSQQLTSVTVAPTPVTLAPGASTVFTATARDQFANAMSGVVVTWSIDSGGVGTIAANGLQVTYIAPASGTGAAAVRATSGKLSGKADVTIQTGPAAFQQDGGADGLVVMEAENNDGAVAADGKSWTPYTATAGFSGASAMQVGPNTDILINTGYVGTTPRMDFRINFVKTGVHYVWVRGLGLTGNDDTIHVGLDGVGLATSDRLGSLPSTYGWTKNTLDGVVATINVATVGAHTLNVWMREDGAIVDKVLLTTNAAYTPTGVGPASSTRGPSGGAAQTNTVPTAAPAITALTLIDTDTKKPVPGVTLSTKTTNTLTLATLPPHITVQATIGAIAAGSVLFGYDGNANFRVENGAPYFFNGDYIPFAFTPGTHTLTATPFSGTGASGTAGSTFSIVLKFI